MLLLALVLFCLTSPRLYVRAQEETEVDLDDSEPMVEDDEPVVTEEAAPEEPEIVEEEPVVIEEEEPVVEAPTPEPTPAVVKKEGSAIKEKVSSLFGCVKSKCKAGIDKVKGVSSKDAKKIAAAVLGVWGVSVGVGWLAQTANQPAKVEAGKKK